MKINDDLNKKILNILLEDSKLSYRNIAKKAGISGVTALKRIKELKKAHIIKNYTIELDYEKMGYDINVIIMMKIERGIISQIDKKISGDPNVYAIYDVTGQFDCIIMARFKNRKDLDLFIKKILTYDFVERTETILTLNIIKEKNINVH